MQTQKFDEQGHTLALREDYPKGDVPPIVQIYISSVPILGITAPELIHELYVTYNKYFDKHHLTKDILFPVLGNTILMQESSEDQSKKRKILSTAFYKEKLIKMTYIVKQCMQNKVSEWNSQFVKTEKEMDFIAEVSNVYQKVLLSCAFGEDLSNETLDYYVNGVRTTKRLGFVLREVFHNCMSRQVSPQIALFPSTAQWYIASSDRENRRNAMIMRQLFKEIVTKRREEIKGNNLQNRDDFLSILLTDDLYKDNEDLIIDECLTFFFAGSQTSTITTQNMILHMLNQPKLMNKVREELYREVVEPARKESSELSIAELLNYDNIFQLTYFSNCFSESLRIEPPVQYSSLCTLTQTCKIGPYTIRAGDQFSIFMHHLHWNKTQWIEPEKYIPERFDPNSKYYLTPEGNKRHPMAFGPFLGGKRICLGKTFIETMSKIVGPTLIGHFDFEFVDQMQQREKPRNNLNLIHEPVIMVKVKAHKFD